MPRKDLYYSVFVLCLFASLFHILSFTSTKSPLNIQGVLPICDPVVSIRPMVSSIPFDVTSVTEVHYKVVQHLVTGMKQEPLQIDSGIGIVPLDNGQYFSMNRRIPYNTWKVSDPHMCMQVAEFFNEDLTSAYKPCMFLNGADVRIFTYNNRVYGYTLLNTLKPSPLWADVLIYSANSGETYKVVIDGFTKFSQYGKNWMPFEYKNELYFIHSLEPSLVILKVDLQHHGPCVETKVGCVKTVSGKFVIGFPEHSTKHIRMRGSTPGIVQGDLVVGVGHISEYKDQENEGRGSQIPFLWYFDMNKHTVHYVDMKLENDFNGHKRYIYPISLFTKDGSLYMTATDSYYNWFDEYIQKSQTPLSDVRNLLYKIYV